MPDATTHIWFGWTDRTQGGFFQWAPAPVRGIEVANAGYSEGNLLQSGRRSRYRSLQFSKVYTITAVGEAKDMAGYSVYNKAASGFYGRRKWRFADPFAFETNLLPVGWSEPARREVGWYNTGASEPTFSATAPNSYGQPPRKATFDIQTPANATPLSGATIPYVDIPIPPTHVLHVGCTGASTGSAQVRVEGWVNGSGAPLWENLSGLSLLSETGAQRLNYTLSGATYNWARIFYTRSGSGSSALTLTSLMAQLWPIGYTPELNGHHIPGEGHTQLDFADAAVIEDYVYINPPQKGISTVLEEVI